MKTLDVKLRRQLVDAILKECDVISQTDIENLLCVPCAAEHLGVTRKAIRDRVLRGTVHVYRLCHREKSNRRNGPPIDYIDKRELKPKHRPVVRN